MEDCLIMSRKDLNRKTILDRVQCGKLSLTEAALKLDISYRQAKRIIKRYREEQDEGLRHKNKGRKPNNAYSQNDKEKIINLYKEKYMGFGPTFASEKFLEDELIEINAETLRLWLKEAGLWHRKRKYKVYRERRERRPCFGDLLQIDGSIHAWFGINGENDCLLNVVDDATGITMARLAKGETTEVLFRVLKMWFMTYGIPKAVYVDLKQVYVGAKQWMNKFDEDAPEGFSVFQRACKDLGIEVIKAYSPQAKGRVERKHAIFQDRLVKDIRLYQLKTIDEVNYYLESKFLAKINEKFAKAPQKLKDSHRSCQDENLDNILCWYFIRKLRNDWTLRFKNEYFQLEKTEHLQPMQEISIKRDLDGNLSFSVDQKILNYKKLDYKPEPLSRSKLYYKHKGSDSQERSNIARENKYKSPWSKFNPKWLNSGKRV